MASASRLDPQFWIERAPEPDAILLDANAIAALNAKLQQLDPSLHDIENLPSVLPGTRVKEWIANLSRRRHDELYDAQGHVVSEATFAELIDSLDVDGIPDTQRTRYGIVVQRADLRTFPTRLSVYKSGGDIDIDRFQESALFPGMPVAIVHESRDRQWWFVVSTAYAAWIEKRDVAEGPMQRLFDYTRKTPCFIVTGATARTSVTAEQSDVSELQLDMGVRVPAFADWPSALPVIHQHTAYAIELPVRTDRGEVRFRAALLPKTADVATDYLPLSRANLLRQSFKFLGERYGWGHAYDARDCSGFVSEVYRSFGVQLPRNSRDQGRSPALNRIAFTETDTHEARLAALRELHVGDLIYVPGHVMMAIGHENGVPYVIHDTARIIYDPGSSVVTHAPLSGVSVAPLTSLPGVENIYSILRIRP